MEDIGDIGVIDVPAGWTIAEETSTDLVMVEPESVAVRAPMSPRAPPRAPRAAVAVARTATVKSEAKAARAEFVAAFASGVEGLRRIDEGTVHFSDGAEGASVTLSFPVGSGKGVLQRHLFRIEAGILTQITGTVGDWQRTRLEREIHPILISYRP